MFNLRWPFFEGSKCFFLLFKTILIIPDLFLSVFVYMFSCRLLDSLTVSLHPHAKAFPQPTELAAIAVVFVDDAVLFTATAVGQVLPHTPLEEAFTSLTADCSIVAP